MFATFLEEPIFDDAAIGVARSDKPLREHLVVHGVGIHLGLKGDTRCSRVVNPVLCSGVAKPVAGVDLQSRRGDAHIEIAPACGVGQGRRVAEVATVPIVVHAEAVVIAVATRELFVFSIKVDPDQLGHAEVKDGAVNVGNLSCWHRMLVNR